MLANAAEEDLAMWEAFKTSLEASLDEQAELDAEDLERLARERTARAHSKAGIREISIPPRC